MFEKNEEKIEVFLDNFIISINLTFLKSYYFVHFAQLVFTIFEEITKHFFLCFVNIPSTSWFQLCWKFKFSGNSLSITRFHDIEIGTCTYSIKIWKKMHFLHLKLYCMLGKKIELMVSLLYFDTTHQMKYDSLLCESKEQYHSFS